jgi:hypothetical protein
MLDDVERRRLLPQPAREDAAPKALRIGDVDLDESPGQLLRLPRRGGLAGAQADDDIVDPHRLAGFELDIARLARAFVEKPEHGDTLRHRRGALRQLVGARARLFGTLRLIDLARLLAAAAG